MNSPGVAVAHALMPIEIALVQDRLESVVTLASLIPMSLMSSSQY